MPVNITATRSTSLSPVNGAIDQDGDGFVDFGDTLFIRLDIANSGNEDALNVVINDALLGQTLVNGSINFSPLAVNDVFNAVGNTQLIVGGFSGFSFSGPTATFAGSVLSNDGQVPGDTVAGLNLSPTGGATLQGGTFSIEANGAFVYRPALNFVGTDSFNYTVSDSAGLTSTAKVTINVSSPVWYVNQAYDGSNGASDGSSWKPFTSLAQLGGAGGIDGANSTLYVQGNHTADIALETGQTLIGTGAALVVNGYTLAAAGSANTLTHGTGTGVLLATNNTIRGVTLNGTANSGTAIADNNGAVGTLTITDTSITGLGKAVDIDQGGTLAVTLNQLSSASSVSEGVHLAGTASSGAGLLQGSFSASTGIIQASTGTGVLIGVAGGGTASSGGSANFTFGGDISSPGGSVVEIQDRTGGAVTFSGQITEGAIGNGQTGILIDGNAGTINFNGQTFISAGSGTTGNGVTLTNNSGTINFNATGTGLDITTTSGTGLTFTGGGTLNITGSANSVTTSTGQVLNLQNGAMGTSGIAFQTLTSGNVATGNAININNLDAAGAGVFSGGAVTIGGTAGAGADGIAITSSNSTFNFASAVIDNTQGDGIDINGAAQTQGAVTFTTVNLDGMAGAGVNINGATNSVNINGGTIGSTNDPAGDGVNITNGTGAVTVAASVTQSSGGNNVVDVTGHSGGAILFSGAITAAAGGGGIRLVNNSGGNIDFTGNTTINTGTLAGITFTNTAGTGANVTFSEGTLDLDTTSGTGINATSTTVGAGSLTISGNDNFVNATTGRAINIDGVTANITLEQVGVSGGGSTTGVFLKNTGSGGQFIVQGNASVAGSGGTIANISGADLGSLSAAATAGTGIYLENVSNVSLSNLTMSGTFTNYGIRGENVNNFTLRDSSLTGTFGTNEGQDEGTIRFGTENISTGLRGTALFEGNTISGGHENNLSVYVYGNDSLNMTVKDSANDQAIFGLNSNALGDDSLHVESGGTGSNLTLTVDGVAFNGARGDMLQTIAIGVTTQALTITNNQFLNTHGNIVSGGGGVDLLGGSTAVGSNANITYNFSNNTIKGAVGNALDAIYTGAQATISGVIANNTIGTNNGAFETNTNRGSQSGAGIDLGHAKSSGTGSINHAVRIEGNNISDIGNLALGAIRLVANSQGGGASLLEVNVKNNIQGDVGGDLLSGLYAIVGGQGATDPSVMGLTLTGNTLRAGGTTGGAAIFLDQLSTNSVARYNIPGYNNAGTAARGEGRSSGTASTALTTFWNATNTLTSGPFPSVPSQKVDAFTVFGITNAAFGLPAPLMAATVAAAGWEQDAGAQAVIAAAAAATQAQAQQQQQGVYFGPGNKFNGIPGALGFANDAAPMDVVKIYDPVTGKLFDNEAGAAAADAERGLTGAAPAAGGQQTSGATAEGQEAANAPGEKGGPDLVQVVAAPAVNPIADDGVLTQAELDFLVDAAIKRWIEAGATEEQVAAMRATKFSTADLGGLFLGKSNPGAIILDDNAAGHNWYLDATPGDDAEFKLVGGVLRGAADTIEGSRVDLLTAIMHELGHQIGLEDSYDAADNGALMYGFVNPGERHLPGSEEVAEGTGAPVASTALALGAINFGTLEAGTTRSISWKTTYDGPGTNRVITDVANKSTVTYNNGAGNVVIDSTTNTLGTGTFPAVDSLTLGGTVWNDNGAGAGGIKGNGARDGTEAGINGVTMALFVDANNDNVADTPGTSIATATTAGGGNYSFANLAPGNYIVRVDQTNFDAGGALVGAQTSSVTSPEPVDPDDNVDNDDNGARSSGNPAFSYALTLDYNSEPTTEDGDADTNFTLDFGFLTPNQAPTFASPSAQPTYNENAPFVVVAPSVTVSDENANFNGGTVSIALTSGGTAGDVVGIATSTTPGTGIEINGGTGAVSYNGTVIGTATSATSVTLNAAATTAAIQALAQAVIFTSSSDNPTATPRVLTFTFNDGGGTASGGVSTTSFTRTITVVPSDDAPVAVADSYATDENVILNVAAGSGVLFNDTDVDGGVKTVASINGNPANVGVAVTLASGAKVTLNADGSLSYDPNGVYNYLVPAGSGAVNTSAIDSFTYALNGGSSTTVSVTVNGVAGAGDQLRGDAGNNVINGTNGDDSFRLGQGGDDIVNGGDGNDGFYFGAAFTGADQVDGGAGTNDQIGLQGNYAALSLTSAMIANVEVIALLSGSITTFGDTANNFYDYNITVPAGTVAVNNRLTIQGTSLRAGEDFTFNGSASGIDFILYGGLGVDNFTGGSGNDGFYFGEGRFSSSDIVNGGAGTNDQLGLDGNYGTAGTPFELSGGNISGVEVIALLQFTGAPLKTYVISTNNSLVGAGQNLTIWALPTQTGVTVDGSAETDGRFTFFGGAGADRFTGGNGGDSLTGGGGADTFAYTSANQSTGFNFDQLIGFDDNSDKIDLPGAVASFAAPASGTLSLMSFNADLAAGVNAALGPNQAIVFTANGGDLAGRSFGVVDANGDGDYQAGTDYVFEFVNPVTPIDQVGMFI